MKVEILEFTPEDKGIKKGSVDFKVTYSKDKWEIFRKVSYFEKEGKRWLLIPATKRGDNWVPLYEREPSLRTLFTEVLKALETQHNNPSIAEVAEFDF